MRYIEPFIQAYMRDTDVTLLKENLKLSPQERFDKFYAFMQGVTTLREAGQAARRAKLRAARSTAADEQASNGDSRE